jgi:hypothetical protein
VVRIVLVSRETSLRSVMMDSSFGKRCESGSIGCRTRNAIRPDALKRIYWTMVLVDASTNRIVLWSGVTELMALASNDTSTGAEGIVDTIVQ